MRLKPSVDLGQCREEHRLFTLETDEVGLLFLGVIRVLHPFKPTVRWGNCPSGRPELFEELSRHYGFDSSVDWGWSFAFRPERLPPPPNLVDTQTPLGGTDDLNPSARSHVVALYGQEVVPIDHDLLWGKLLEVVVHGFVDRVASAHDVTPMSLVENAFQYD
uniref:Uncharacterized protein n=1 Tax=Pseudomonas syringae pv. actinidiae TaxID=103796 RepID=A0A650D7E9_PSESF|nr:hypothetical protein [Pseudomonas syringae pv. actinidiae]